MHIEFAPVDEKYIKDSVKNGYYRSEAEAVRDAVRRAREQEEAKHSRLLTALQLGEGDASAGRTVPYTPDFLKESTERARKIVKEGKPLNPDVCP